MAWDPINANELTPGFAILKHMRQAWNCLLFLFGQIGTLASGGIANGSFEVDSDGNGQPDNWTLNTYPGGSGGIVTTGLAHGINAIQLVHPGGAGNGGGYYESDYAICSELQNVILGWIHWASVAGMHNKVTVRFFNNAKVYISAVDIYNSTANPTAPMYFVAGFLPPAGSRFYKVDLTGGHSDTNVAGTSWFDAVGVAGLEGVASIKLPFGTMAEVGTASEMFVDVASTTFICPVTGPVLISFAADLGGGTGDIPVSQRFRVGAAFSASVTNPGGVGDQSNWFTISTMGTAGALMTINMQLITSNGAFSAIGRKTTTASKIRFDLANS